MVTVNTKLVGLLGNPLGFTFSPDMHNAVFNKLGLDYFYFPIEVGKDAVGEVVHGIRYMNFAGFNVTKPNKVRILRYLDQVDELAEKIGSVNTVKMIDGKLKGYNTDGEGFVDSLVEKLGEGLEGKIITILGGGGAGRAIAFTLAHRGAEKINILDQVYECFGKVATEINANICDCAQGFTMTEENLRQCIDESNVIINATGVGMIPHIDRTPFSKKLLRPDILVCDITYNPVKTKLLLEAEEIGCETLNGIGMLVNQGAKAFEIWTGVPAPIKEMTEEVNKIIADLNK